MDPTPATMPIGRSGRLECVALVAGADAAVLVREVGHEARARALLTTDKLPEGERLVVMPLDDEVDVRVDGDAMAVWIGTGWAGESPVVVAPVPTDVPAWATIIGGAMLVLVLLLTVIGSAVAFSWLVSLLT